MYTREILPPRASPIENGIPLTGTWNRAFEKADLLEIRKPYKFPWPAWARDYRIKEWQCFSVQDNHFILDAIFCNLKLYRAAQVLFYDLDNGKKYLVRKVIPGAGWRLPVCLSNALVDSHSYRFYFRIHNWLDADTIKLDINIEAALRRPSLTVHLAYNANNSDTEPMAVSMGVAGRRIIYAYKMLAQVRGDMVFDGRHISLKPESCSGFFCDYKGFYPYRAQTAICSATGFIKDNRRFGFHIAENQTRETNKNNENALWIDGKLTPLPPVLITMPGGPDAKWVIQDVEGMVDLTFTPKEQSRSGIKLIFTNADFIATIGFYNGVLVDSEGEHIRIKNLAGIGKKFILRV